MKNAFAGLLLMFVACSFVYLLAQQSSGPVPATQPQTPEPSPKAQEPVQGPKGAAVESASQPEPAPRPAAEKAAYPRVIAYYFHGATRCVTCKKLEAYSEAALRSAFPKELEAGVLEWRTVNIDEPENKHFIKDYQLFTKSLVISRLEEGEQVDWKNLDRIWKLVGDKDAFAEYVRSEVRLSLEPETE
ncbi:MAG: nitrophenyl compound nitroreductase subunit ArsF family protein [Elusimicrobiota bacterium]